MNYKYTYESPLGTMVMLGTLSYFLTDLFLLMKLMHLVMMMRSIEQTNRSI